MYILNRHNESAPIFESALNSLNINNFHLYIYYYVYKGAFKKNRGAFKNKVELKHLVSD
jgi:hypothetical protein